MIYIPGLMLSGDQIKEDDIGEACRVYEEQKCM